MGEFDEIDLTAKKLAYYIQVPTEWIEDHESVTRELAAAARRAHQVVERRQRWNQLRAKHHDRHRG